MRKFYFAFLYSALPACFIYLLDSNKGDAILFFVVLFIPELIRRLKRPEGTYEPRPKQSKSHKVFNYIVYVFILSFAVFLTVTSTASISCKVGAWLILFMMYPLDKIEKFIETKYGMKADKKSLLEELFKE